MDFIVPFFNYMQKNSHSEAIELHIRRDICACYILMFQSVDIQAFVYQVNV